MAVASPLFGIGPCRKPFSTKRRSILMIGKGAFFKLYTFELCGGEWLRTDRIEDEQLLVYNIAYKNFNPMKSDRKVHCAKSLRVERLTR